MPHILIVDDAKSERMVLRQYLEDAGYEVTEANCGDDAIAKARAQKPDAIVMDVEMPGINGFQATRTLARDLATHHIPVIMCTSKSEDTDKTWAQRQGAVDYIIKPYDPELLLARVRAVLSN